MLAVSPLDCALIPSISLLPLVQLLPRRRSGPIEWRTDFGVASMGLPLGPVLAIALGGMTMGYTTA
jgi:hypothetical protein